MDATKTSYQIVDGVLVEWNANGSIPALKWTDPAGNNWRAKAAYMFDSLTETYAIVVNKDLQLSGSPNWNPYSQYNITADHSKYRRLSTGEILPDITGIPAALDALGNIVAPTGWVYNSKYFTIAIGYNPSEAIVNINQWVYIEIAEEEGLTIV